jgi:type II secretory pathway pseudopilin PulG
MSRQGATGAGPSRQVGFTIVELVVVVALVAALVGVVIYSVSGINANGQPNECRTEKRQVQKAIEAFDARRGRLPSDIAQLVVPDGNVSGFLDHEPKWYRKVAADGTVADPGPGRTCHGI